MSTAIAICSPSVSAPHFTKASRVALGRNPNHQVVSIYDQLPAHRTRSVVDRDADLTADLTSDVLSFAEDSNSAGMSLWLSEPFHKDRGNDVEILTRKPHKGSAYRNHDVSIVIFSPSSQPRYRLLVIAADLISFMEASSPGTDMIDTVVMRPQ